MSAVLFDFLLWGDFLGALERAQANHDMEATNVLFFAGDGRLRDLWAAIEADALLEWTRHYPGTRPPAWWRFSAVLRGRESVRIPGRGCPGKTEPQPGWGRISGPCSPTLSG